jgi:hypothetical protein
MPEKAKKNFNLPKSEMTLDEFFAIKEYFSGADFERNSTAFTSAFVVSAGLWFF